MHTRTRANGKCTVELYEECQHPKGRVLNEQPPRGALFLPAVSVRGNGCAASGLGAPRRRPYSIN
jgi:hypothetical protein